MLFDSLITVIIFKDKICRLVGKNKIECTKVDSKKLNYGELIGEMLKKLRKKEVRVFLSDDFIYTFQAPLLKTGKLTSQEIGGVIAKYIPSNINDVIFDWRMVSKAKNLGQFLVIDKVNLGKIFKGLDNKYRIESVRPYAFALAQNAPEDSAPYLLATAMGNDLTVSVVFRKGVFVSQTTTPENFEKTCQNLIDYSKQASEKEIQKIYFEKELEKNSLELKQQVIKISLPNFSRFKEHREGDFESLGFAEGELIYEEEKETTTTTSSRKNSLKLPIIIAVILALLVVGFILWRTQTKTDEELQSPVEEQPISDQSPSPEPAEATPSAVSLNEPTKTFTPQSYKLLILNGSGETGAAQELRESLETADFASIEIDNADRQNYSKTLVYTEDEVIFAGMSELLKDFELQQRKEEYSTNNSYDIVVIIGRK